MAFTFATSGAIVYRAGKNVDANIKVSGAFLTQISEDAEALINNTAGVDLISKYDSLTANGKKTLQEAETCYGGMQLISYDQSVYTSRQEAQSMLDVLDDRLNKALSLIKDDKVKTFLGVT